MTTPERSAWQLLRDPLFGPFFLGRLISTAGIWISNIVSAVVAFELSGSALVVGLVSAAQFGPQLVFGPLSGSMADRGNRKLQMVVGRSIVAVGAGSLGLTIGLVGVDGLPGAWVVVAAAAVVGTGFVVGGPAMNALVPSLVRPSELSTAVALNSFPLSVSRAAGPGLGALLAASAGPGVALGVAAATNAAFALIMVFLPLSPHRPDEGADHSVRAGLGLIRRDRGLIYMLLGIAAVGVGADPVVTLTPSLAADFGGGTRLVGVLASSFGVGAMIGVFVLPRLRKVFGTPRLGSIGLGLLGGGLVSAGLFANPASAIAFLVVGGSGLVVALSSLSAQLLAGVPEGFRGRTMGLFSVAFLGSRPAAAAFDGLCRI